MSKLLDVSSSPHVRSHETTHSIMLDVVTATLFATAFDVYHFSIHALPVLIATVAACALDEYVYEELMEKQSTVSDCSALVTDMILVLNMPPEIPVQISVLSGIFAIITVKQLYGGLGQNFTNPALVARCFLLISFAGKVTNFSYSGFDDVSGTTPLAMLKSGQAVDVPAMFVGDIPGTIGEVSAIALLIGAAYLLAKEVTPIRIPGTCILTVVVFTILFEGHGFGLNYIAIHLCGGGLISGAFSMATDYVISPTTPKGQIVFGILLDVSMGLFGISDGSAEGVSYTITISNMLVPLTERVTLPKAFGKGGK